MIKYFYLIKRMFKRPSFYSFFILAFFFVTGLKSFSIKGGQIATIGICCNGDSLDIDFDIDFKENSSNGDSLDVFNFQLFSNFEEAKSKLIKGEIDEIWKFPNNLNVTIENFVRGEKIESPVEIFVLNNSVAHFLLKEVLFSKLYSKVAQVLCCEYLNKNFTKPSQNQFEYSSPQFIQSFNAKVPTSKLFVMQKDFQNENTQLPIILLPLRGMISLWILIFCFSLAFIYFQDDKNGIFVWWNCKSKIIRKFLYFFFPMIIFGIFSFMMIIYAGILTNFIYESISIILYLVSAVLFVNVFCNLCGSCKKIGILLPIIILLITIFSPIFIEFRDFRNIGLLFPNVYYLKSIADKKFLIYQLIYILILSVVLFILEKITDLKKHID